MTKVIALSSVTGGGKTTIVNALMDRLPNAMALYFDDYGFDENVDYGKWLSGGGDYNEWDLTALKEDLLEVIENPHIDYILLDYPFAYKNNQIKPYIDFAVYIDKQPFNFRGIKKGLPWQSFLRLNFFYYRQYHR